MFHIRFVLFCIILVLPASLAGTWYNWGGWGECSRSCDGGLSNRRRTCFGRNCDGINIQYKVCNTQVCSSTDLPEYEVCHSQNGHLFNGGYRWVPRQTYQCSVYCAEETNQIADLVSINLPDGMKCSKEPNHYCINGNCQKLGCDGEVGSQKVVDECGVCDGNGTFCNGVPKEDKTMFLWDIQWSACSVSCGIGFQTSQIRCRNVKHSQTVSLFYCDYNNKPTETVRECSLDVCDPRWRTSLWNTCSVECGGGVQKRKVLCIETTGRAKTTEIADYRCPDPIPPSERPCNTQFCPSVWQTGQWAHCSATCGIGTQTRPVYCVKSFVRGMHVNVSDSECMSPKPQIYRPCSEPPCFQSVLYSPHIKNDNSTFIQLKKSKTIRLNVGVTAILLPSQPVKVECPVDNFDKSLIFWTKNSRLISTSVFNRVYVTSTGALKIRRTDPTEDAGTYTCMAGIESGNVFIEFQSEKTARQKAKKVTKELYDKTLNEVLNKPQADIIPGSGPQNIIELPSTNKHSNNAVFITSEWTKCSRTCGTGFQTRKVSCNIITDSYVKIVPESECQEKIPESNRVCIDNPMCPTWTSGNWTECSINTCQLEGVAAQTRDVYCAAENNVTLKLPIKRCDKTTRPESSRQCLNELCVAVWKTSKWTRCKPSCAKAGKKTRILACVWKHNKKSAKDNCKSKPKPEVRKPCKPKHCKKECYDTSRYCSITKILKMCRYRTFHDKCCATCTNSVPT